MNNALTKIATAQAVAVGHSPRVGRSLLEVERISFTRRRTAEPAGPQL